MGKWPIYLTENKLAGIPCEKGRQAGSAGCDWTIRSGYATLPSIMAERQSSRRPVGHHRGFNMRKVLQNNLLIFFGWIFLVLGAIGVILPLLPTTPFLILALALFSKSSPRFHQMLLNNTWFGPTLKQWADSKTLPRKTKYRVSFLIVVAFAITVALFNGNFQLQLMLIGLATILLFFIWRIKEHAG
jgi:hypothetical protein